MSEQDSMDRLLRKEFASDTTPMLSPTFNPRLTTRLQPRRLNPKSRAILTGYSLVGTVISIGAMLQTGLPWWAIVLAILVPLAAVAILLRRHFRWPKRRMSKGW